MEAVPRMYSFSILFIYFIFHHHKDVQVCCCRQRNQLDLSLQKQKFIPVLHNLLPNTAVQYASVLHEANLAFTTSMRHELALATITELSRICHDNNKNQVIATDHRFTFGVSTMHDVTQVRLKLYLISYILNLYLSFGLLTK